MVTTKRYLHDRFVLLILTINGFLTIVIVLSVLLRLGDTGDSYVQQYRSNLGLNGYIVGGVTEIMSFALFAIMAFVFQIILSLKTYDMKKEVSWAVLLLTTLSLVLCLIVSNALLELR